MTAALEARKEGFAPCFKLGRVVIGTGYDYLLVELVPLDGTPAHPAEVPLARRLQEQLGVALERHGWHMTLAYCPKGQQTSLASVPSEELEAERRAVEAALATCPEVVCHAARLCRFEDMTAFEPWEEQPYKEASGVSQCRYFLVGL